MVLFNLIAFVVACAVMIKAADYAVRGISGIERRLKLASFIVSFFLVGLVSSFPEGFVSIVSIYQGVPSLGFGTLMGSVIADLSIVLGLVGIVVGRAKLSSGFRHEVWLLCLLLLPIMLAIDGVISRLDGIILIGACILFFYNILQKSKVISKIADSGKSGLSKDLAIFIGASIVIFISANFVVKYSKLLAVDLNLPVIVVGLVLIAMATSLPELVFALAAAKKKMPDIALGEILGVVVIDATLLMGIVALIQPIVIQGIDLGRVGIFVMTSLVVAVYFLRQERVFTWRDGIFLVFIYVLFVITELATSRVLV